MIVCDRGVDWHGAATGIAKAERTVSQIPRLGLSGAVRGDCADWDTARSMVQIAIDSFGRLDGLVLNAGIMRLGTVASTERRRLGRRDPSPPPGSPPAFACTHWRTRLNRHGRWRGGSSPPRLPLVVRRARDQQRGLMRQPRPGSSDSRHTCRRDGRHRRDGQRRRSWCDHASRRSRTGGEAVTTRLVPERVSPVVAWLMSDASASVTGRVFNVMGGRIDRSSRRASSTVRSRTPCGRSPRSATSWLQSWGPSSPDDDGLPHPGHGRRGRGSS